MPAANRPAASEPVIAYEVTVEVRADLMPAYELYMTRQHVPDVLATGCFTGAEFARAEAGSYRQRYFARTSGDLHRYLAEHAARLREDFLRHFPDGALPSRRNWELIRRWPGP